jgi:hypothetical protein
MEELSWLAPMLVVWLLCGLAAALAMRAKARGGLAGFLIGFLLGPLGLVIALVLAPDHREAEKRALSSGDMRRCPHCAELIRNAAQKCRYCGSRVTPLQPDEPEGPAQFGDRPEGISPDEWQKHVEAVRDFH